MTTHKSGYSFNDAFSYRSATTNQWITWTRDDQGKWWANDGREEPATDADVDHNRKDPESVYTPAANRFPYPGGHCPHGSTVICPHCEPRRFKVAYVRTQAILGHHVTLTEMEAEDIVDRAEADRA